MSVVVLIIIGAAAGFIATRLLQIDADVPTTILIGVIGALLGGLILRSFLAVMGMMAGFVGAVLGAILVILFWQKLRGR